MAGANSNQLPTSFGIETSQIEPPADALKRTIPEVVVGGVKRTPIATLELPHTAMLRGAKNGNSVIARKC